MDMALEILVIILSAFLAIFLVLGIILLVYLIRLSAEIKKVTESLRHTFDNIDEAVVGITKLVSPVFIAQQVGHYFHRVVEQFKKSEKEK